MIYALNLYDIIPEKEHIYKEYLLKATAAIGDICEASPVACGHNPQKSLAGKTRNHLAVMAFPDLETFERVLERLEEQDLHRLREESTENYIWTVFEPWDIQSLFAE